MHNCKTTREAIGELLVTNADDARDNTLSSDLENCDECRAEFDSVKNTLRITSRLIETATPPDSYWTAYHATLKQKLINSQTQLIETNQPVWLARLFKASVHVPVPVAIGLMLSFALSLVLVARGSRKVEVSPQPVSVVRVPIQVPVIKEKPVIRIVYRERRAISQRSNRALGGSKTDSSVARSQSDGRPAVLAGFKPLDEIKLTVIKGGSANEK